MPHYEFFCKACMKTFSKVLTFTEYEESKIMCPHCGSREVEQQLSPFSVTSKKSQSSTQENGLPPSQNEDSWERVNLSATEEDDRARVLSDWESEGGAWGHGKTSG